MWKEKFNLFFALGLLSGVLGLSACGGGGGGGGAQGSVPVNPSTAAATVTISITPATVPTHTLTSTIPLTVKATVKDSSGTLVKNTLVTFTTGSGSGLTVFSPSSGTAMSGDGTGATVVGEASIGLSTAPATTGGATTIIATATINGVSVSSDPVAVNVIGASGSSSGTPTLTMTLSSNSLTYGTPVDVTAVVKNGNGVVQPNVVVNFTADANLVTMTPVVGSSMTDANGIARIQLNAASLTAAGAGYLTATAISFPSVSTAYSVGAPSVTLGPLVIGTSNLSASGTTSVSVDVSINGGPPSVPITVNFSSQCATGNKASLTASATTRLAGGKATATATYTDNGCGGSLATPTADEITATVAGQSVKGTISVAGAQAANIQFVSLAPETGILVLKGTGGVNYSEVGNVKFQVVDNGGRPVSNQSVDFSLTTYVGGIQLDGLASPPLGTPPLAPPCATAAAPISSVLTKITDVNGFVSVNVQSGSVPTPVWVKATTCTPTGSAVSSQSNKMTISTGVPSQDFFTVAPRYLNIEGMTIVGEPSVISAIVSDRLGNPVPDGTAVNFISEGAQLNPSICLTDKGSCEVTLFSAESRPTDGRITILAYALGEESFTDLNNNNVYDSGEPFEDLGNAFIDKNENRSFDSGEQQIVFKSSNQSSCSSLSNAAPPKLANAPWADNTCDGVWGPAHVRRTRVIVLSDSSLDLTLSGVDATYAPVNRTTGTTCSREFRIQLMDRNGNPMPVGTELLVNSNSVFYKDSAGVDQLASVATPAPSIVPNTSRVGGTLHTVTLSGTNCAAAPGWSGSFVLRTKTTPNPDSKRNPSLEVNRTTSLLTIPIP